LALIESTLEFARFFAGQVLPRCRPEPDGWHFAAGLEDLLKGGRPAYLAPGPLGYQQGRDWKPAVEDRILVGPIDVENDAPLAVALRLLQDIYLTFGIDPSHTPYSELDFGRSGSVEKRLRQALDDPTRDFH
jgi:hypothetical protein